MVLTADFSEIYNEKEEPKNPFRVSTEGNSCKIGACKVSTKEPLIAEEISTKKKANILDQDPGKMLCGHYMNWQDSSLHNLMGAWLESFH